MQLHQCQVLLVLLLKQLLLLSLVMLLQAKINTT
jgi:hypothetical protein